MTRCYNCREANLKTRRESYAYDLTGLPYVVTLDRVPVSRCPKCGEHAVSIPDPEGLHRTLALEIIARPRALLPEEIRFLRKVRDWTAEEAARVMGIDAKTLSRWENGKQKMGPVAERLLRLLVRELEPHDTDWARTTLCTIRETKKKPSPVRMRATKHGWRIAA